MERLGEWGIIESYPLNLLINNYTKGTQMRHIINYLINIFHALGKKVKFLIFAKFDWLRIINNISTKKIIIFYTVLFCAGRYLLYFHPIRFDVVHQLVLTIISFMAIFSLKYAYEMTNKLKNASSGLIYANRTDNCTAKTIKMLVDQMINCQQSIWWPIIMLFPPLSFIRKNLYLGFIQKNPAGYYAVIFGASAYYLALLGYVQIAIAFIQFYRVAKDEGDCIPLDFPNDALYTPEWLSIWNQIFQKIIKVFFCVGTLFTLEYIMLMPPNIVTIDDKKYTFNVCDVKSFLISWSTIFIFIIFAFPIIYIIINNLQKLLIKNLSKKINYEYRVLFSNISYKTSALDIWIYKQLLESSSQYKNYILSGKNMIPIASTFISFSLNIIKFSESILLPLLNF